MHSYFPNSILVGCYCLHPVHPHACGELGYLHKGFHAIAGSSPRMWGTPFALNSGGNSFSVHPHACGELVKSFPSNPCNEGSSPRMWGTLQCLMEEGENERFIPTHVGNSHMLLTLSENPPVHPHACGELTIAPEGDWRSFGSSPRMWGTRRQYRFHTEC